MAQLVPLGNHIVVQPLAEEVKSSAGILLPDRKEEMPQKGRVIAAGPGKLKDDGSVAPMNIKVGDVVLFKKYSPDEFNLDGEKVLVLAETDVFAKIQ